MASSEKLEYKPGLTGYLAGALNLVGIRIEEEPNYQVLLSERDYEIRQYEPYMVAQTTVRGSRDDAANEAFVRLANYIFGKNSGEAKMSMTSPVFQEPRKRTRMAMTAPVFQERKGATWLMSFVLPAKYTRENVPRPLDRRIRLQEVPEQTVAVLKYKGRSTTQIMDQKSRELRDWLRAKGYKTLSAPKSAQYDPPMTVPFLRRNEIQLEVERPEKLH